ncbi:UDP-N-acetylmuramoyl-tripeptide--D-alanyl-D-alanine ligase [Gordonia jinghuaiqii]|uniref:UDP-N-acetylmuramoyl-tripeptide--D-alanyl-D-alanine ligase n=1 Tax=Gordonia jinghuaiqii TaxID=2758710 RepID=A0A7D7RMX9_9ACTN|nr:UDP-N-acetylmuramoyl-tripeptide--D-alanyl-D-alanine ligase [Gordonia jinghuaiqii]MCR5977253.1 UDP-N-acetylmuramoyl-tripeptide--D-alanyl-D-alanine ligase [Gordonia jinghuaiqii]QMT00153.1 UDP-N-acetylmuramoyl-tripeptide--D-alanyl-D-alanine ligase [Gordonia jinghuaiqii]
MTAPHVTVIRGETPVTVDDARLLVRRLVEFAGSARGVEPAGSRGTGRPRTWAIIAELASPEGVPENQRVVEHDLLGRLAVRLAVDKTLCVGDSRSVHALHQGAVMEGSWGDEARIVATVSDAAELVDVDPDWRPAAGDVILVAAAGADLDSVVDAWGARCGWQPVDASTPGGDPT